jgi:ribonuclease D
MKIHPLITTTDASPICARLAKSDLSRSTPSSCARTPIGRTVPGADRQRGRSRRRRPLAPGIDLFPLLDLLVDNEDVLKVFHAAGRTWKSSTT